MKTALIGLGRIGWRFHLPELTKRAGFGKVIVVDTNADRLAEAKESFCVEGYSDFAEMLKQEHPNLVVIASPTHLHKMHALMALESGADVFLDKPMARDLTEAQEIADAAVTYNRKLMIYQPHRVTPELQVAKRILASGKLGKLFMVKRASASYNRRADWQAFRKFGGGMLNNYGAHYVDQVLYLTGANVTDIQCWRRKIASLGDADDVVKIVMDTQEGILLDIDISQAAGLAISPMMLFGQYGTAELGYSAQGQQFRVKYLVPEELPPLEASEILMAKDRQYNADAGLPWHEEIIPVKPEDAVSFYDYAESFYLNGGKPLVEVCETMNIMRILKTCAEKGAF